ncbi:ribonuclease P protein component 4 [Methanoplanus endosymbiosus]|uniref:Ribonuclease P protein component 4 n=1 Tax=Methanoplanus endosymbiosus TaxID=33865 RepID=A0A9E7THF3_9EURY|nr:ribonuclease P protein component 4 [Methanoplanus endosymbiosus]UUX92772.1 ribonuclease P [Methanoplanus endosymbiosus]
MAARKSSKTAFKKIAEERIDILFKNAEEEFVYNPELSNRYVDIARKIAMRQRIRIPVEYKRRFCRNCHSYAVFGENMSVRIHRGKVIYRCSQCGYIRRIPITKGDDK